MSGGDRPVLAVLGAINVDLVVAGAPLPKAGETVTGGVFARHHGGKGGNQAVAAARARRRGAGDAETPSTWMLGSVGDEPLGASALEALRADGVGTEHVLVTPDAPTGVALIAVAPDGENQISVAPGANLAFGPDHVVAALGSLRPSLLLASLEVAPGTLDAAVTWCLERGAPVVLNPAPWQPWARGSLGRATYVTPNTRELAAIGQVPAGTRVVETRGAAGAVLHARDGERSFPAPVVDAVDTTGAGDCFSGVFAARLADGAPPEDAVADAVLFASVSTTLAGAREGMPDGGSIAEARSRLGI